MTKAAALDLHRLPIGKKGEKILEEIPKSAPLLMARSQAAVAESEKHDCHQRTLSREKLPVHAGILVPAQAILATPFLFL